MYVRLSSRGRHLDLRLTGGFFKINLFYIYDFLIKLSTIFDQILARSTKCTVRVPAVHFYRTCHACHEPCAALPTHPGPSQPHTHVHLVASLLRALVPHRTITLTCLARSVAEWPSSCLSTPRARAAGAAGQPIFGRPGRIEISSKREMVLREQEWMDKYDWDMLLNQRRAVAPIIS